MKIIDTVFDKDKQFNLVESAELSALVAEQQKIKQRIDELSAIEEELRSAIFEMVENQNTVIDDYRITYSVTPDKVVPDYEKHCKLAGIVPDVTKVTKGRATRRITQIKSGED
jgi:hypothetical protein